MAREVISGIYKIELKDEFKEFSSSNGVYIGQSIDVYRRFKAHKSNVRNNRRDCKTLYRAMKKYGSNNFIYNIVEKCDHEYLDNREMYWIEYYNSYKNGYNENIGGVVGCRGEQNGSAYITQEIADNIRAYYRDNYVTYGDTADKFNTTRPVINKVLNGISYLESEFARNYIKPKSRRITCGSENHSRSVLTQEIADEIRVVYTSNEYKQRDLAEMFEVSTTVIQDIIYGKTYLESDFAKNCNIKIKNQRLVLNQCKADKIREKYNKGLTMSQLAVEYAVSSTTISRIINKKTYMKSEYAKGYKKRLI